MIRLILVALIASFSVSSFAAICSLASNNDYWLCRAIEDDNCGLASSEDYLFCRAVVDDNCAMAPGDGYWLCRAITDDSCGMASLGDDYSLCLALNR